MQHIYVIASSKAPKGADAQNFLDAFRGISDNSGAKVVGCIIDGGRGCVNYGVMIDAPTEEDADRLCGNITMALMPSKWANANPDPRLSEGVFADVRRD